MTLTVLTINFSLPELTSCEVYDVDLVDEGLADTYDDLTMLPGYVVLL
jgi:hypothetical protein